MNYAQGGEVAGKNWPQVEILPEPLTRDERTAIDQAVAAARASDVAIVVLGDGDNTTGESLTAPASTCPAVSSNWCKPCKRLASP